jgi:hypothetical protein
LEVEAMISQRTPPRHDRARGTALVVVVVAVFVLTIVGVGLAYFSSTEDRISGNDKLQKEGFYTSEAGLRIAERALNNGSLSNTTLISGLLAATPGAVPAYGSPNTLDLHDGGYTAVLLKIGATPYRDLPISFASGTTSDNPRYTLYIRNNKEDQGAGASATVDTDKVLNVISVGYIRLENGKRITKIIEEQISSVDMGTGSGFEKGSNEGGTNG